MHADDEGGSEPRGGTGDRLLRILLQRPKTALLLLLAPVVLVAWFARDFRVDASSNSIVLENDQVGGSRQGDILVAIIVEIHEKRCMRVLHPIHAGLLRDVAQGAVGLLDEEQIWHSALLTDVDILQAVTVDIAQRNALMAC